MNLVIKATMQVIENFLFVHVKELIECGVPVQNIVQGAMRYRNNKSRLWVCRKDPHDRRKLLILYKAVPASTKKKYQLPSEEELFKKYELQKEEESRLQRALTL